MLHLLLLLKLPRPHLLLLCLLLLQLSLLQLPLARLLLPLALLLPLPASLRRLSLLPALPLLHFRQALPRRRLLGACPSPNSLGLPFHPLPLLRGQSPV